MFGFPGQVELIVIAAVFFLLFGNRLPSVLNSLGQGIKQFRDQVRHTPDDE